MTALVTVVVVLVAVAAVTLASLRWRKLRRDATESARRLDPRLISPPPSPYAPSQGFKLVDGEVPAPTPTRPTPPRPRLDERTYVFGEAATGEEPLHAPRHDSHWALERMSRHRRRRWRSRQWLRLGVVVLIVVLAAGYTLQRGRGAGPVSSTTTTWPSTFVATAHGSHAAGVSAPGSHYAITVSARATSQVVIKGVADNYFHGPLAAGQHTTVTVNERVAIFLDSLSVSVSVGGSKVVLPTGAAAPYFLTITPTP